MVSALKAGSSAAPTIPMSYITKVLARSDDTSSKVPTVRSFTWLWTITTMLPTGVSGSAFVPFFPGAGIKALFSVCRPILTF